MAAGEHDLLLTDVRARGFASPVDVAVVDGRIAAVGPDLPAAPGTARVDGGGRAVLPGLVEPHLHLDKALLDARRPGDGTLDGAVAVTAELKADFTVEDVATRADTVLRWAVQHGTTCVRTPVDVDPTVGLTSLDALLELRERWAGTVELQVVAFPQEGIAARPGTHDLLVEALRRGADVIGACSYAEGDVEACREHVRTVFDLAERFGVPVDVHADFPANPGSDPTADPRHDLAADIADLTAARGLAGRVVLGHVTTLGALGGSRRRRTLDALAAAQVGVVVLPPTDLYLQGWTAPLRELADAGVATAFSSNNVRNAFTPFGTADVLDVALLLAQTAPFPRAGQIDGLFDAATAGAAAMIGAGGHALVPGERADLVVLDGHDHHTTLLDRAPRRYVIAGGRVVAETETRRTLRAPDPPIRPRERS